MQNENQNSSMNDNLIDLDAPENGQGSESEKSPKKRKKLFAILGIAIAGAAAVCFFIFGGLNIFGMFRSDTTINGVDVSYMTPEKARAYFAEQAEGYTIEVSVNGQVSMNLSAENISMEAAEVSVFEAALSEQRSQNVKELTIEPYTCNFDALKYAINLLGKSSGDSETDEADDEDDTASVSEETIEAAKNIILVANGNSDGMYKAVSATLKFDADADEFVIEGGTAGTIPDADTVADAIYSAVQSLDKEISLSGDEYLSQPSVAADSEEIVSALEFANAYKNLEIELSFTPDETAADASEDAESESAEEGEESTADDAQEASAEEEATEETDGAAAAAGTETLDWSTFKSWLYVDADGTTICVDNTLLSEYVDELADKHSVTNSTAKFKTTSGEYIEIEVSSQGQTVNSDELLALVYDCLMNQTGGEFEAPYDTVTQDSDIVDFDGTYVEVDLTNQVVYCYKDGELVLTSNVVTGCVSQGHGTPAGVFTIKSKSTGTYLVGEDYKSWVNYWIPFNGGVGFHDATWRSSFGGNIYYNSGSHGCVNMPIEMASKLYSLVEVGEYVVVYEGTAGEVVTDDSTSEQCKDGHTWSDWKTTKEATCKSEGMRERTCSVCGTFQEEPVATSEHKWGDWTVKKEATCSAKGKKTRECSVCGTKETEEIDKKDHTWGDWEIKKEATCTEAGKKKRKCSVCGETEKKEIKALGHDYVNGVCTRCGATQ